MKQQILGLVCSQRNDRVATIQTGKFRLCFSRLTVLLRDELMVSGVIGDRGSWRFGKKVGANIAAYMPHNILGDLEDIVHNHSVATVLGQPLNLVRATFHC
jgi:hypothetical protein